VHHSQIDLRKQSPPLIFFASCEVVPGTIDARREKILCLRIVARKSSHSTAMDSRRRRCQTAALIRRSRHPPRSVAWICPISGRAACALKNLAPINPANPAAPVTGIVMRRPLRRAAIQA